jgi:amino acid transporter
MFKQLLRTRSLDALLGEGQSPEHQLRRALGSADVVLLGIGAIMGAGIFTTIGTAAAGDAARPGAGPALILSFAVTAVVCGIAALCYAEFAAMVPVAGSAYTYAYGTRGEMVACAYLMMGLPAITWYRFGLWLAVGLAVYLAYGRRRSRLNRPMSVAPVLNAAPPAR